MSKPAIHTVQGSYGRAWAYQFLTESGQPQDLTDATGATFSMRLRGASARKVADQAAVIASGTYTLLDGSIVTYAKTDGVVLYQPGSGDVDTDGLYDGQFTTTMPAGPVIGPPPGELEIHIAAAI